QVDVPLLFINGELDEHTTPTDALHFADLVRSSEYVTIRQAGHFLVLENEAACDAVAQAAEGLLSAGTQARRLRRSARLRSTGARTRAGAGSAGASTSAGTGRRLT